MEEDHIVAEYMRTANTLNSQNWLRANWHQVLNLVDNAFPLPGYDRENGECTELNVENYMTTHVFWIQLAGLILLRSPLHFMDALTLTEEEDKKFAMYMKALILLNNRESIRLLFKYDALPPEIKARITKQVFDNYSSELRLGIQQDISSLIV